MEGDFDRALVEQLQPVFQTEINAREEFFYGAKPWTNGARFARAQTAAFEKLDSFIEKNGWPTSLLVGPDVARKVADLVLNLVTQPSFMRQSLPVIEQKFRFGEVPSEVFCLLYDKVMWLESKPQLFGTFLDWGGDQSLRPLNVFEPSQLDVRRKGFFLEPHSHFVDRMMSEYSIKGRKPPQDLDLYNTNRDRFLAGIGWPRNLAPKNVVFPASQDILNSLGGAYEGGDRHL